jgi:hypothetical protein
METLSMEVIAAHCAGIDVGSRFHMLAVDQNLEHIRKFKVYTAHHHQLILYLQQHHLTSVALESTGSYWQTLGWL